MAAPISINNERYYQGVIVIRDITSQRFYLHEVLTEKEGDTSFKTGATAKHTPGDVSPSLISLLKKVRDVNSNFMESSLGDSTGQVFSRKQSDPIQAHYAEVMRENRNLKNIISALDDMQLSSARNNIHLDSRDIHNIAGRLLRTASSKYELKTFEDELTAVYDYMSNRNKKWRFLTA